MRRPFLFVVDYSFPHDRMQIKFVYAHSVCEQGVLLLQSHQGNWCGNCSNLFFTRIQYKQLQYTVKQLLDQNATYVSIPYGTHSIYTVVAGRNVDIPQFMMMI